MAAWVWQGCHTLLICAHLCLSVGGTSPPGGSVCSAYSVGIFMFSHRFHGSAQMVRLCRFSHGIHGIHRSYGALLRLAPDSVRRPIGFRPPSDQIPSAVRSDSVRRPIGFRSVPDENISRSMGKNVAEVSGLLSTKSNTNSVKLSLKQLRVSFCQTRHSAVCQQKTCATPFGTPFVYQ